MSDTFILKIGNHRFNGEREKTFLFVGPWTRKNPFLHVPKSQIIFYEFKDNIHTFELPMWLYDSIKEKLEIHFKSYKDYELEN